MASLRLTGRGLAISLLTFVATGIQAQQFSSFWRMTSINGVSVVRSGLSYTVSVDANSANRYVTFVDQLNQTQTEYWTEVIGFFKMSDGVQNLGANGADAPVPGHGTWDWYPDQDKVAGWKGTAGNERLGGGDSATFTYASLVGGTGALPSWVTNGFHLQFVNTLTFGSGTGASTGSTFHVTTNGNVRPPGGNTVPEPFTMGLGLAGVGVFIRRRMKR